MTTALAAAIAGLVGAPPAHAAVLQHCRYAKGTISASPGLTDVPTGQTITLATKLSGCSRSGGSGGFVATIGVTAACATLTTAIPPINTTILWANGRTSAVSLSFSSLPSATNRLAVFGRVTAGAGVGDRVEGGLHLSTVSSRLVGQENHRLKVKQRQPLNSGDATCTAAHPLATIKVSSYQSFKFTLVSPVTTTTSGASTHGTQPGTAVGAAVSTTTSLPASATATATAIARNRAAVARQKAALARKRQSRRAALRRAVKAVPPAATTSSSSFFDPEWALLVGCITAAVLLLALLLMPSKRSRRRRSPLRLDR